MVPRTRLALSAVYLAGVEVALLLAQWLCKLAGATNVAASLARWTSFLGWVFSICLFFLALRWFRSHVMWSVRNRLIVTYLFIGALPVGLMGVMAIGSSYLVIEHLAVFLAVSEIHGQEQRLK